MKGFIVFLSHGCQETVCTRAKSKVMDMTGTFHPGACYFAVICMNRVLLLWKESVLYYRMMLWSGRRELAEVHKRLNLELSYFLFFHTRTQHTQPVKCKYSPKSRSNLTGMKLYAMSSVKTLLKNLSGHPVTRKVKPIVLLKGCFYELIVSHGRCRVHSWLSDNWQRFSASFSQVTREWWYHSRIYQFCKSMNPCIYADLLMFRLV